MSMLQEKKGYHQIMASYPRTTITNAIKKLKSLGFCNKCWKHAEFKEYGECLCEKSKEK